MIKTQKNQLKTILLSLIVIILFMVLSPKLSTRLFSQIRNHAWKNFLNQCIESQKINAKNFWGFREFYYPGTIIFNVRKLPDTTVNAAISLLKMNFSPDSYHYPFLYFNSDKIRSLESLTKTDQIGEIIENQVIPSGAQIVIRDKSTLFYIFEYKATIIFTKTIDEMITANGYFNYKKDDKELLKNKFWFVQTVVDLD